MSNGLSWDTNDRGEGGGGGGREGNMGTGFSACKTGMARVNVMWHRYCLNAALI